MEANIQCGQGLVDDGGWSARANRAVTYLTADSIDWWTTVTGKSIIAFPRPTRSSPLLILAATSVSDDTVIYHSYVLSVVGYRGGVTLR